MPVFISLLTYAHWQIEYIWVRVAIPGPVALIRILNLRIEEEVVNFEGAFPLGA